MMVRPSSSRPDTSVTSRGTKGARIPGPGMAGASGPGIAIAGSSTPPSATRPRSLDSAVTPAEDERDNLLNVAPHVEWVTNGLYEFLPALSQRHRRAAAHASTRGLGGGPRPREQPEHSRRHSAPPNPGSRARPSGTAWWRAAPVRATSGSVPSLGCRRFMEAKRTGATRCGQPAGGEDDGRDLDPATRR